MAMSQRLMNDRRARVLIVENDPILALASINECLKVGLEPKLCMGVESSSSSCPALEGKECPRTNGVEATLLSITHGRQRMVAPACVGGRVVLTGELPLVGRATTALIEPDATIDYPYDPKKAAAFLFSIVMDKRRKAAWDRIRGTSP